MKEKEFSPAVNKQKVPTKEQKDMMMKAGMRAIAAGLLPAVINAYSELPPKKLVKKVYMIAKELVEQGEKLEV